MKYRFKLKKSQVLYLSREMERSESLISLPIYGTFLNLSQFHWQHASCIQSVGSFIQSATFFLEEVDNKSLGCVYSPNTYFYFSRKSLLSCLQYSEYRVDNVPRQRGFKGRCLLAEAGQLLILWCVFYGSSQSLNLAATVC